jgi:hypothetical protein
MGPISVFVESDVAPIKYFLNSFYRCEDGMMRLRFAKLGDSVYKYEEPSQGTNAIKLFFTKVIYKLLILRHLVESLKVVCLD